MSSDALLLEKDHLTVVTDLSIRLAGDVSEEGAIRVATILNTLDTTGLRELDKTLDDLRVANRFDSADGNGGGDFEPESDSVVSDSVPENLETSDTFVAEDMDPDSTVIEDMDPDADSSELILDIGDDMDDDGEGEEFSTSSADEAGDGFLDSIEFRVEDEIGDGEGLDEALSPKVVEAPARQASREAVAASRKQRVLDKISGAPDRRRVASSAPSTEDVEAAVIEREFGLN